MKVLNSKFEVEKTYHKPNEIIDGISECLYGNGTHPRFIDDIDTFVKNTNVSIEKLKIHNAGRRIILHSLVPFKGSKVVAICDHSQAEFDMVEVTEHNKIIDILQTISSIEELRIKFPNAERLTEIDYWSMHHGFLFSPPYEKRVNTSDINPPQSIRYAKGGALADDICWTMHGKVYYCEKGSFFEDSIN